MNFTKDDITEEFENNLQIPAHLTTHSAKS